MTFQLLEVSFSFFSFNLVLVYLSLCGTFSFLCGIASLYLVRRMDKLKVQDDSSLMEGTNIGCL